MISLCPPHARPNAASMSATMATCRGQKGQGRARRAHASYKIELWGPYKWPKINGYCNWFLFHSPYKCSYNLTFNWYGAHLERLQIFMPNDVKFVQQFHDFFTDICGIVGDGRSLQGSLKPKTRKI